MFDVNVVHALPWPAVNAISLSIFSEPWYCTICILLGSLILLSFLKIYSWNIFPFFIFLSLNFHSAFFALLKVTRTYSPKHTIYFPSSWRLKPVFFPAVLRKNLLRKLGLLLNIQMSEIPNIKINIFPNFQSLSAWTMHVEHLTWCLTHDNKWELLPLSPLLLVLVLLLLLLLLIPLRLLLIKSQASKHKVWIFPSCSIGLGWHHRKMKQLGANLEALLWLCFGFASKVRGALF